jgi:hypothetical protein
MERVDLTALEARADRYDALVAATPAVDRFCTSTDWILPAFRAFSASAKPLVLFGEHGAFAGMIVDSPLGRTVAPMEFAWGLAAPCGTPTPWPFAHELASALRIAAPEWDALFLSGIQRGGLLFTSLVQDLGRGFRLGLGRSTIRCVASLDGGYDGFLSRRDAAFRKNLRRLERRAEGRITFERVSDGDPLALYARILRIEDRSWKGTSGNGINDGPMREFYRDMVPRLAARGALRITFARADDRDIGFVLGGLFAGEYRGLQFSFDDEWRPFSIGNLMQAETLRGLCAEGISRYDLGTDMAYKHEWAEQLKETVALVVMKSGARVG